MVWKQTRLGEVYDVRDGTHDSPKYQESGFPLVTSKNLKNGLITLEKVKYISELDYLKVNERSAVHVGDVLFAMIGTIGNPVVIKGEPNFAIKNVALFKVGKENSSHFLKYYLESSFVTEKMSREAKGTTQKFVGLGYLRNFPIPLPPRAEQKRIVAILDQAFADIEQARAKTEQNLKNARELFESYLQQVFSQRDEGWRECKLSQLCELISGQHIDAKNYNAEKKGIGYLTGPSDFGVLNPVVTKWTEHPKRTALSGDILITVKGSGVGKVNIMSANELAISRQLMAVRPGEVVGNLLYWFLSMQFDFFQSLANGAAIPGISRNDVLDLELSIPLSLDVQQELVDQISMLDSNVVELERIYTDKLCSLEELKKSLLQKAFTGELTKESKGVAA